MRVVGIAMVKDEVDIIETTVVHMLHQVDHVVIADNGSTDGTSEILATLNCETIDDPDPAYYQSRKMTALAHYAASAHRADWVVPFDADEIWYPLHAATIREALRGLTDEWVVPAWLFDHVVTDADASGVAPQHAMAHHLRNRTPLHKVAARTRNGMVIEMGNHQVTYPDRVTSPPVAWDVLAVRHFPIRSPQQYIRKARQGGAALALTDLDPACGQHWRDWARMTDQHLHDAFLDHWYYRADDDRLVLDPAPLSA